MPCCACEIAIVSQLPVCGGNLGEGHSLAMRFTSVSRRQAASEGGPTVLDRLSAAVQQARALIPLKGLKMLIVDDDRWAALDMECVCRKLGCDVIGPATSREAALALAAAERPDVVLIDQKLAAERGAPCLAREIGSQFGIASLIVGASGALAKPFAPDTLAKAVADAFEAPAI